MSIVIDMDMHIYIRKGIDVRFKAEPNKSELVNKLLKWYYENQDKKTEPQYVEPEKAA